MEDMTSKCSYCGAKTQKKVYICGKCSDKLPLVRELLRIGEEIKKYGTKKEKHP